jgi:hypothetical protein
LESCTGGLAAGEIVEADTVWLHIDNGNKNVGTTRVRLALGEATPCVGALPPDCDHLEGAAPIVDATFANKWLGSLPVTFLATRMNGLVCIDNGANGKPLVTVGTLRMNLTLLAGKYGWQPHIETRVPLEGINVLLADLDNPVGAAVRVRIFAGPPR